MIPDNTGGVQQVARQGSKRWLEQVLKTRGGWYVGVAGARAEAIRLAITMGHLWGKDSH